MFERNVEKRHNSIFFFEKNLSKTLSQRKKKSSPLNIISKNRNKLFSRNKPSSLTSSGSFEFSKKKRKKKKEKNKNEKESRERRGEVSEISDRLERRSEWRVVPWWAASADWLTESPRVSCGCLFRPISPSVCTRSFRSVLGVDSRTAPILDT